MQRLKNLVSQLNLSPLNVTNINKFDIEDMGDIVVMSRTTEIKAIKCNINFIFKKDSQLVYLSCEVDSFMRDSYSRLNSVNMLAYDTEIKCYFELDENDKPRTLVMSSAIFDINSNITNLKLTLAIAAIPMVLKTFFK